MQALILGSAAGGGFPQWNCGCHLCARARAGDPLAKPRTQVSVAVTADEQHWLIVGASPDMRQQILQNPQLAPAGLRHSPLFGVVVVSADVDGIAGLLALREQQAFTIFAPAAILRILQDNRLFASLDPAVVTRTELIAEMPMDMGHGLRLTLLTMPGKVPLYHEDRTAAVAEQAATYAARLEAGGRIMIIAPGCAELRDDVLARLAPADTLLFDGTLFEDEEMIKAGLGHKTGRRMGHVPVSGPGGSLERLADHAGRRIYLHINNSNPILLEDSAERALVTRAGWEVAYDGMRVQV